MIFIGRYWQSKTLRNIDSSFSQSALNTEQDSLSQVIMPHTYYGSRNVAHFKSETNSLEALCVQVDLQTRAARSERLSLWTHDLFIFLGRPLFDSAKEQFSVSFVRKKVRAHSGGLGSTSTQSALHFSWRGLKSWLFSIARAENLIFLKGIGACTNTGPRDADLQPAFKF